jgi:DNA-binding transcriptional MerR regulator
VKKEIFERRELCRRLGVDERTLAEWQEHKLIAPFGFSDDRVALFAETAIADGEHIKRLRELGYGLREIQKIIRKVGLPRAAGRKGEKPERRNFLTVGALAEKVGVSARTIKHWEDMGIIEPNMRSEGGFRYYSDVYVYLCNLVKDLQLFGYSLEDIQMISGLFRAFLAIQQDAGAIPDAERAARLDTMLQEIERLSGRMAQLQAGIVRWQDLLKKKKKEVAALRLETQKRLAAARGGKKPCPASS